MKNFQDRRKNYYINKQFQRNFILKFCALIAVSSIISSAIIYAMSRATVTTTFENSRLAIKSTADYILPMVLLSSLIVIISVGMATILVTLFTSHRIAGPLYRIEKDVNEILSGNLNVRFNLRAGDEIKPLAVSLDMMAQDLKGRIIRMKRTIDEIETAANSSAQVSTEAKDKIKSLKEEIKKFRT